MRGLIAWPQCPVLTSLPGSAHIGVWLSHIHQGPGQGSLGWATRSHSCLPELFTASGRSLPGFLWKPLPLPSHPRDPHQAEAELSDFRSDALGRGQGRQGFGPILQMLLLAHMHVTMGWPGPQPSDPGVTSAGQDSPMHSSADLLCPVPTPPPSAAPASSSLSGFWSCH